MEEPLLEVVGVEELLLEEVEVEVEVEVEELLVDQDQARVGRKVPMDLEIYSQEGHNQEPP